MIPDNALPALVKPKIGTWPNCEIWRRRAVPPFASIVYEMEKIRHRGARDSSVSGRSRRNTQVSA